MRDHIIPVNVGSDGNLFGGLLRKRNVFEAAVILISGFLVFQVLLFAVPFFIKTILFVVFVLLPAAVCLIGIGDQSVFEALLTVIAYKKRKDIIPYSIQVESIRKEDKVRRNMKKNVKGKRKKHERNSKEEKRKMKKQKETRNVQEEKIMAHSDGFYVNMKPDMRSKGKFSGMQGDIQKAEARKQRRLIAKQQKAERILEKKILKARSQAVKKGVALPHEPAQHYMYGSSHLKDKKKIGL